jgi:hypothetical protein
MEKKPQQDAMEIETFQPVHEGNKIGAYTQRRCLQVPTSQEK